VAKKSKKSQEQSQETPKNTFYGEYKDALGNQQLLTKTFIESLGVKLIKAAQESDGSDDITALLIPLGVPTPTFYRWVTKYPELAEDYSYVKYIMASKMIKNGLNRKHEASLTKFLLHGLIPNECKEIQKIMAVDKNADDDKVKYILMKDIGANGELANKE
jgi:hypothetical protein